ncbi:MAG: sodium:solute symporter family protein, partial [Candidatus Sumerlaeia bacterium]|nr:sodium:solute symporter family protein [Candidatus Sumerlaeia bacterium]
DVYKRQAFVVGALSNVYFFQHGGEIAMVRAGGDSDLIIPTFITSALPSWFVALFALTLLSAAMSTQSSQFHTIGTALGRDIYEQTVLGGERRGTTVLITRIGIVLGIALTLVLALKLPGSIIPAATALFFGLCASAFLPMYFGGLYCRWITKAGAIAGMCVGFFVSMFWLFCVQMVNARFAALLLPFVNHPNPSLIMQGTWRFLDALVIAFPLAVVTTVVVSLITRKMPEEHLNRCFHGTR